MSFIAATASGSLTARQKPPNPARNASENTANSGNSRNKVKNPTAIEDQGDAHRAPLGGDGAGAILGDEIETQGDVAHDPNLRRCQV